MTGGPVVLLRVVPALADTLFLIMSQPITRISFRIIYSLLVLSFDTLRNVCVAGRIVNFKTSFIFVI